MTPAEADGVARLRTRLATRKPVVLLNPDTAEPARIITYATAGFDAIFLDVESGTVTIEALPALCAAVREVGALPLVRPPTHDRADVLQCLQAGALGVVAPGLPEVAAAREFAQTVALAGDRGPAPLALGILESVGVCARFSAFANVAGIDAYMIGPRDLGRSMMPQRAPDDPVVRQIARDLLGNLAALGRACGMPVGPADIDSLTAAGCSVFYVHAAKLDASALEIFRALGQS